MTYLTENTNVHAVSVVELKSIEYALEARQKVVKPLRVDLIDLHIICARLVIAYDQIAMPNRTIKKQKTLELNLQKKKEEYQ